MDEASGAPAEADRHAGAERLDRRGYELEFHDEFDGERLDPGRWVAHYLPQWTTPERSAARYALDADGVRLLIEADQPAWLPADGPMRVSNVQTGSFSGPLGSPIGQHRHRPGLAVATPQPARRLWTPSAGLVEVTARASPDPRCMLGIWLVGFEDAPHESGEICLAELFGDRIGPGGSTVRLGIKAHHDPALREDVVDLDLDLDATEDHTYAAEWDAERARFFVDDVLVREARQGTSYPLMLLIDLFEFPAGEARDPSDYPKSARVRAVRGYARR